METVRKMMILGCPPKTKKFQKGTLGGSRCGQKYIKRGVQKRATGDFFAHCPPSKKTDIGGETDPFSKAVDVAFAQGLLLFFDKTIGDRTLARERVANEISVFRSKTGPVWDPLFLVSGGSRSGPKRVKVPPWRSLGGSLAAFGRI